ncbi:MAG TPA: DUF6067 family protein, partial [bacterium]|nr:DUF6067 family protein [bacterium]
ALILPPGYKPIGYAAKGNLNPGCGSVEMWVKPLGWQQLGTLLQWFFWTENQGPTFLIPNDGFTVMVSGGAENMEVDYPPDTWTHFILTWADRLIRLYVNGQEKLSSFMTVPFDPNKDYVSFGPGSGKPMLIDELTIYKRAFSAAEVANHYHRYVGRKNFTPLPAIDCVTNFFQGAGRIAGVAFTRGRKETGQMRIQLSAKGQPVEETTVPYHPEKGAVFLLEKLPVPLPQGEYFLKFEFQDKADGKILLSSTRPFSFKFYPWLGNTIGLTERVLKPWTPMKEKDGVIEVVGRQHQLDKTGLFSSLINQGKEMLAEPMRLEVTASEKTFSLAGTGTRILTRKATEVHWQSQAVGQVSSQILKVNIDGLMEYDGHTVFTLKTNPPDKPPLKIDRFSLVLPLKADLPQFFLTVFGIGLPYGVGTFPHYGQLPRHEGNIFSSKVWYEYVGWDGQLQQTGVFDLRTAVAISEKTLKLQKRWKPTLGNFLPQLWVGNDEIGLSYMADNDRGWIPVDEEAAITLERKGQVVEWRFNFISLPYLLKEAREI